MKLGRKSPLVDACQDQKKEKNQETKRPKTQKRKKKEQRKKINQFG